MSSIKRPAADKRIQIQELIDGKKDDMPSARDRQWRVASQPTSLHPD